jgi:uncharacterized protein YyaL (SSP411 family)
MSNHLKNEHSPYLQQHANNPVDWYPWGSEAFEKAQNEHKPIFLSIGYSSCHWCHVMEKESFENDHIAKILNDSFVSIKVDREERPDIDKHFQEVYQLMNGRPGGWPTSIFLTEELKPFYSATYIPSEQKYGMMAFDQLLSLICAKYTDEKALLTEKAEEVLRFLHPKEQSIQATKLDDSVIGRFAAQAKQLFDQNNGGFNAAPKFPQTSTLDLLMDCYLLTGNKETLQMALTTLTSMTRGGFYDRVDGGFCRYSTDDAWLVPHFEKMTYDNALLTELFLRAYTVTKNNFYRDIALDTIHFMCEKMSEDHLFYSASDADTQGEEGKYFVYTYDEALRAFTEANIPVIEHERLAGALGISKKGNFEDHSIVHVKDPGNLDIPHYAEAIEALKKTRSKRTYPFIDKKIIVSWNAMMIKSLFKASRIDHDLLGLAVKSLDALQETMLIRDELYHSALIGKKPKIKAFLEDYAYLCDTLIEAYECTLEEHYLILAIQLSNKAIEKFYEHGKWKFSRGEFETKADIYDNSYPSSVAIMLGVLCSISALADPVYQKFVFKTLEINSYEIMRKPILTPKITKIAIRYLKDDVIIKADKALLKSHQIEIGKIAYPFTYIKSDTNQGFMLCTSTSCFGHADDIEGVIHQIADRF